MLSLVSVLIWRKARTHSKLSRAYQCANLACIWEDALPVMPRKRGMTKLSPVEQAASIRTSTNKLGEVHEVSCETSSEVTTENAR
jgi:hypothetical protein